MQDTTLSNILHKIRINECALNYLDLSKMTLSTNDLQDLKKDLQKNTVVCNIKWGKLPQDLKSNILVRNIESKLQKNTLGFKFYPDPYQYGLLSLHAYNDANVGDVPKLFNDEHDASLQAWKVIAIHRNDTNGYYGTLYRNSNNCQLVLAHRGTEFTTLGEELFKHKDISADISGVVSNKFIYPMLEAYKAVESSIALARESYYHLSFTGHSLGAWLAELSVYFSHVHLDYGMTRAITFDSPGSSDFFTTVRSNVQSHLTNFDTENFDIITYLSIPNIINSCNRHTGQVYSITPKITEQELKSYSKEWDASRIKTFFAKSESTVFMLTALGHKLDSIIREFNPTTGAPNEYRQMLDWPCLMCDSNKNTDYVSDTFRWMIGTIPTKIMKALLKKYTTLPAYNIANLLMDLMQDKVNLNQYLRVIEDDVLPLITQENELDTATQERILRLKFEGHFDWQVPNAYIEPLRSSNVAPEHYLKQFIELRHYFIYSPTACDLTGVVKEIIVHFSNNCDYTSASMYGRHPNGVLNSTDSGISIDSFKQSVMRLFEVSANTVQMCLDLHKKPELWYEELIRKSGSHDSEKVTQEIISSNGNLDAKNTAGNTLIQIAVSNNRTNAATTLLNNGASVDIVNNAGQTVYDIAVSNNQIPLAKKLHQFKHISSSSEVINLDKYGIYDGNEKANIFVINSTFEGQKEGYKLMIDSFTTTGENQDKIDLSIFQYKSIGALDFDVTKFASREGIKISDKITHNEIVTILHATDIDAIKASIVLGEIVGADEL